MQKNLSNKELVAAGHKFAANISADTPLIDMAKMVSELATQLDVALAAASEAGKQRDTLATENAALVNYIDGECYTESKRTGVYTCAGMNKPSSPATEACLNAVRVEALGDFAKEADKKAEAFSASARATNDFFEDQRFRFAAAMFRGFARQLRAAQLRAGNAGKAGV